MFWLQVLVALGIILATVLVAGGRGDSLDGLPRERAPQRLPLDRPVVAADVLDLRLGVALRGYRMDEVDDALDKLAEELASRDAHIAELEQVAGAGQSTPLLRDDGPEPGASAYDDEVPSDAVRTDAERPAGA